MNENFKLVSIIFRINIVPYTEKGKIVAYKKA